MEVTNSATAVRGWQQPPPSAVKPHRRMGTPGASSVSRSLFKASGATASTATAGSEEGYGSKDHSDFLATLDGCTGSAPASPGFNYGFISDDFEGVDVDHSADRLSVGDLAASKLPAPDLSAFQDDDDDQCLDDSVADTLPCPPTPTRTPAVAPAGRLVRQNSLKDSKVLVSAVDSVSGVETGGESPPGEEACFHDRFDHWSIIGQGSFSIAFQVRAAGALPALCLPGACVPLRSRRLR